MRYLLLAVLLADMALGCYTAYQRKKMQTDLEQISAELDNVETQLHIDREAVQD